ncbi:MAG: response regulator [Blastocatellia bacterium]
MKEETTRVLLIEDDPVDAEIVRALIGEAGEFFELEWVTELGAGLSRLERGGIDVALIDFGLPDSHGIETFIQAHERAPGVAMIPLTATGDEELALKAIQLGAEDYLFKGAISGPLLVRSIRYSVERKRGEEALRRAHDELELRVRERTAELSRANILLMEQITVRRRTEKELRTLSNRLVEVQELERRSIARELHDEIGQILTGLKLALEMASRLPPPASKEKLLQTQELVNELMRRVRDLSLDLRPAMLDDLGLLHALLWHFERYTSQTGIRVLFRHTGIEGERLHSKLETAAYRIIQEALTNVARHAGVADVAVAISADIESLSVRVEDHGRGFESEASLEAAASSGLPGMRERARLLGGRLEIRSAPGIGTTLTAVLPLIEEAAGEGMKGPGR